MTKNVPTRTVRRRAHFTDAFCFHSVLLGHVLPGVPASYGMSDLGHVEKAVEDEPRVCQGRLCWPQRDGPSVRAVFKDARKNQ